MAVKINKGRKVRGVSSRNKMGGGALFGLALLVMAILYPFLWPLILLPDAIGKAWAWVVQVAWFALLGYCYALYTRHKKRKARVAAAKWQAEFRVLRESQAAEDAERQLLRARMALTGTPWHDLHAGHYRHGTCTIKHRSAGAAGRCSSTI